MSAVRREDDQIGCRRHQPFHDEECSWCVQAKLHWSRTEASKKQDRREPKKDEKVKE